jgi:uncharacterized membrane-anchored protein YitT (DUF2179 family)
MRNLLAQLNWRSLAVPLILLTVGSVINAISVLVFMAPFNIAPGGVSGIAVILNKTIATPIGLVVLLGNIPIQWIAYRMLGGARVVAGTVFFVLVYSLSLDVLEPYFPPSGISNNVLLNALFAGIVGGFSAGLIYQAGGTLGGTSTLTRILQQRFGTPLSTSSLYTDTGVFVLAALVFGWEAALYAIVAMYVGAAASDFVLEGPSVIRTAFIITDQPQKVADAVLHDLQRGVTAWEGKGMFTEQGHTVLFVTIARPQVNRLRQLVIEADPNAFIVIGQGHVAYGRGFKRVKSADGEEW